MFFQRSTLAIAAGFGLLQAGCFAQSDETGVEAIGDVGFNVLAPGDEDPTNPSNTSRNGLETWKFHAQKSNLAMAFSQSLYDNGGNLNPYVQALLGSSAMGGHDVFKYAAKCMVPAGTYVNTDTDLVGHGLLNMSGIWPNWGLGSAGSNEGFACMAVHLNPFGVEVGIKVGGIPIQDVPVDPVAPPDTYTFKEALWAAEVLSPSIINIHVWPLDDLYARCTTATNNALATRVCGDLGTGGSCGLVVHSSAAAECTESSLGSGVYPTCLLNGAATNVIQTWLDPEYVSDLYGGCVRRR